MKVTDQLALVDVISRELQSRYTFSDIDNYLSAFGITTPESYGNSKWVYSKIALRGVPLETILKIADDLGVESTNPVVREHLTPKNWERTTKFRLFVSHISKDKLKATRLRDTLEPYAVSAFVAHQDIHPTQAWQDQIERALHSMEAFLAIHTKGFSLSTWTQQEI